MSNARTPKRSVLCRTCANWLGRAIGEERRTGERTCSAGMVSGWDAMECESYVRALGLLPLQRPSGSWRES